MVMDKFQVRATGPINQLTKQPVKGRKKGGGMRLGEMERDSLISHGVSFCMYDRLLDSSDGFVCNVCTKCGDLLLPTSERCTILSAGQSAGKNSLSVWVFISFLQLFQQLMQKIMRGCECIVVVVLKRMKATRTMQKKILIHLILNQLLCLMFTGI